MSIVAFKRKHCCFFKYFLILCTFYIIWNRLPIYKITISSFFLIKSMHYVVFLVSLILLKRTCVRKKYGLPNVAWQRMLRQSEIQFIHWLLLTPHSQPSVSHLGLWVLSEEERWLNTAWISHFSSSQWPVHNPLETHQGKLTQKVAIKVEKNQFHSF